MFWTGRLCAVSCLGVKGGGEMGDEGERFQGHSLYPGGRGKGGACWWVIE